MTAILINTINDYRVVVHSTTEHPSSSYGMPVWVDKVDYEIIDMED